MNIEEERNSFLIECRSMMGNAYYPTDTGFSNGEFCDPNVQRLFAVWLKATAQRDEGLAREAELQRRVSALEGDGSWGEMALTVKLETLQQRLAEAEETLAKAIYRQWYAAPGYVPWVERGNSTMQDKARDEARHQLASPGCADGEKTE